MTPKIPLIPKTLTLIPHLFLLIYSTIAVAGTDLFVTSADSTVKRYDGITGAYIGDFVKPMVGFFNPIGLAFDTSGALYVSEFTGDVHRFNSDGSFKDIFVLEQNEIQNWHPFDLEFGPDGDLYVVTHTEGSDPGDPYNGAYRFDGQTGLPKGPQPFAEPIVEIGDGVASLSLLFQPDGHLLLGAAQLESRIERFEGPASTNAGAYVDDFVSYQSGGLSNPADMVYGPDGNLYVADTDQDSLGSILRYDGITGGFMDVFVSPGSGGLANAAGLTFGPDKNLYVSSGNQILKYKEPGTATEGSFLGEFVTSGSGGLAVPHKLAFHDVQDTIPPKIGEISGEIRLVTRWIYKLHLDDIHGPPIDPTGPFFEVKISTSLTDNKDLQPALKIIKISGKDLNQEGRAVPSSDIAFISDLEVALRPSANGYDRFFTIMLEARDRSGNVSRANVTVTVPFRIQG